MRVNFGAASVILICAQLSALAQLKDIEVPKLPTVPVVPAVQPVLKIMDPTKPIHPSILVSSDPTKPPPIVQAAGKAVADRVDKATAAIAPSVKSKVDLDHGNWSKKQGGEALKSTLQYAGGRPITTFVVSTAEPALVKARRLQATVEACLLQANDAAFDRTVICVAEIDPKAPTKVTTRNVEVRREAVQAALKKWSGSSDLASAVVKVRGDDSATMYQKIAAELGLR